MVDLTAGQIEFTLKVWISNHSGRKYSLPLLHLLPPI
jgi:hypothetical protein